MAGRPCYECGQPCGLYPVGDHWLCPPCRQHVLDVVELAAALNMSIYDLAAAVVK